MKWQPIETAPTDGTRILLCGRGGKIADGHYGQPDGFANPKRFVWPYIHANPTHWAPLALIAAAPELLAAARKVNALSIQTDAHKELRAAIAKATGRVVADDAAPECTCAAKDMTFGRCCKLTPNKCKWCGHDTDAHDKQYGCAEDWCDCETPNERCSGGEAMTDQDKMREQFEQKPVGYHINAYRCLPFSILSVQPELEQAFRACGCDPSRGEVGIVLERDLRAIRAGDKRDG